LPAPAHPGPARAPMALRALTLLWLNAAVGSPDTIVRDGLLETTQQSFLAKSAKTDTSAARDALNKMYAEAVAEVDLLKLDCNQAKTSVKEQLQSSSRRLSDFSADVANSRASIAEAQQGEDEAKVAGESLAHEGHERTASCKATKESLAEQLKMLLADAEGARKVAEGTTCDGSAALLECAEGAKGESFLAVGGSEDAVAALSPKAKQAAQRAMQAVSNKKVHKQPTEEAPPTERTPVAERYPIGKRRKCTVSGSASCPALQDALAEMVGDADDAVADLRAQMGRNEDLCNAIEKQARDQHQAWTMKGEKTNVDLALATKHLNEASEHERLGREEKTSLQKKLRETEQECTERMKTASENMCGIQALRLELLQMSGEQVEIQDCQVGEWMPSPCSQTCGGGEMTLTREVLTEPVNGAACPPLQMVQTCNTRPCPVDCVMMDWSGWSECSKDCGGGVRQRVRQVHVEPEHGGAPCPAAQEEEVCNVQPCDQGCQYTPWSDKSLCSAHCGGGWRSSTRGIAAEPVGLGTPCADPEGPERLMAEVCNEEPCPEGLKCESQIDLVVLLDGSGSVGDNLAAQKAAAKAFLDERVAYGDALAHVGVAVFGGDVVEVSPLTADKAAAAASVDTAALSAKPATHLAPALEHAASMLQQGRPHAPSVILVLLEGMPADGRAAAEAAKKITQSARVVVAPVGPGVDYDRVATWASFPARQNVLAIHDFASLGEEAELTRFVAALCPMTDARQTIAATLAE